MCMTRAFGLLIHHVYSKSCLPFHHGGSQSTSFRFQELLAFFLLELLALSYHLCQEPLALSHIYANSCWLFHIVAVLRIVGLLTSFRFQVLLAFSYHAGSKNCWPSHIMGVPGDFGLLTCMLQELLAFSHACSKSCWPSHTLHLQRAVGLLTSCMFQELLFFSHHACSISHHVCSKSCWPSHISHAPKDVGLLTSSMF